MAKTTTCNLCGKEFDMWDAAEATSIYKRLGYGSKYDEDWLELDICCKCLDTIIDQCEINPIIPYEGE